MGLIPERITGNMHEIIVNAGKITSSPFFKLRDSKANCSAAVPLDTATPYFLFNLDENFFSNSIIKFPADDIEPMAVL